MPIEIMDYKRRFQRLGVTPFSVPPDPRLPFSLYGQESCKNCRQVVDVDTEAVTDGVLYLYKRKCKRCGGVLLRGSYMKGRGKLSTKAKDWLNQRGPDRSR